MTEQSSFKTPAQTASKPPRGSKRGPKLFYLIDQAHKALFKAANRRLKENGGITSVQQGALFYIGVNEGCLLSELASGLSLKKSAITGLVNRLEKANLIIRREDKADKRASHLFLTDTGRAAVSAAVPYLISTNQALLDPFSPDETAVIVRFLTHVITLSNDDPSPSAATDSSSHNPSGVNQ